jgi:glutamine synthetase
MTDRTQDLLDSAGVKFIRILWCDNGNVIRGKAVHRSRLSSYLKHGVGISEAQQAVPATIDAPAPSSGLGPVGEVRLVPDLKTLKVLPHAPEHAQAVGDMVRDGKPWPYCPRNFLKRMIAAASQADLEIKAAFENEFYLLEPSSEKAIPADLTVFASSVSMDLHFKVIDAITDSLMAQGMTVEQYYPESGPGQQEITILYTDALRAADHQIAFRETVRSVARQHHLRASFVPKIFADQAGSGCHLHLSLWRDGDNVVCSPDIPGEISPVASRFMAGILHHLPALMALTAPSANSYRRIRPHCWSGAFKCWGFDNREAAIRVPTHPSVPSPTHFELKTVDGSANPYLAMGSVIAAGLDGIERSMELPEPVAVDPGSIPESERISGGIDRLPADLGESISNLEKNETILKGLGPDLSRAFLAVRKAEWETMKGWDIEAEVKLLSDRY